MIVYFTRDRKPFGSRIAEDVVRSLYDHLINLELPEKNKKIDIFIYSRGGDISVPWRITTMIREFCDEFNVLIPYKAQSAATLLSLGADNIIMGKKAELGPIDPTLVKATVSEGSLPAQEISVEDVNSFISFLKERANINDQEPLAQVVENLVKQISPLTLGRVNRQHSHIRLVARKLLSSRNMRLDEEKINTIIEILTEKIYSHGHTIGRKEALDIGLPIMFPDPEIETLIWDLYLKYENYLKLNDPLFIEIELENNDEKLITNEPVALIESVKKLHVFRTSYHLNLKRKIPANIQLNINLNLSLPPTIKPDQIPQQSQIILQNLIKQVQEQLQQLVLQELQRQSPIIGYEGRSFGGKWIEER